MVSSLSTFWWIPLYPLAGAALLLLLRRWATVIAPAAIGLSFLHAIAAALSLRDSAVSHTLFEWMPGIPFAFHFDALAATMLLMVTGIGLLIHIYSIGYMAGEDGFWRYFACLNLFVFFMLLLVLADNLVLLFAGWEGVGLASYLLIGFHHERPTVNRSAAKAFLYNRAGDAGFLLGIFILFAVVGSVQFSNLASLETTPALTAAGLLLALGAAGKSAQLPLFVWLPDAMVGPTPVSALIHAATMVTAGIYLFARLAPFYRAIPDAGIVIAAFAAVTALVAATTALCEHDIKRILAYSTISQLGLMFLAAGLGATDAAMFHVVTHAFFKALLFLCAGNVIHALKGEQDIRFMGGLRNKMPWTFRLMTIGALSLAGFPGLAGFFSKDAILIAAEKSPFLLAIAFAVNFCTALYASRLIWGIFFGNYDREGHEAQGSMLYTLWPLALGSIAAGYFGPHDWTGWPIMVASALVSLAGLWFGRRLAIPLPLGILFARKWFVNEIYELLWVRGVAMAGSSALARFDASVLNLIPQTTRMAAVAFSLFAGWVDRFLVDGVVKLTAVSFQAASYPMRLAQTGRVHQYALVIVLTLASAFAYYWLRAGGID